MFKRLLAVAAAVLLTFAGAVIAAELRAGHPTTYVVQKGDTLWDIAGRFLGKPWLWPEIWQANPQVENPHLIYPGDVLSLAYIDGQPRVSASSAMGPRISEAINTIPLSDVEPFLKQFTVVNDVESLPYVVGLEEGRLYSTAGQLVYVKGLSSAQPGQIVDIARPVNLFGAGKGKNGPGFSALDFRGDVNHRHWVMPPVGYHEATGEKLGYELLVHASGEVTQIQGDTAVVVLRDEGREIRVGDRVLMPEAQPYDLQFMPRAPDSIPSQGRIIAVADGMQAGPKIVVALNIGARDGIRNGHVFSVWHDAPDIGDLVKNRMRLVEHPGKLDMPDDFLGHLMVFRTFDKISYALVMDGIRPIRQGDILKHPDATE
jgi:hypothetical protein